MFGTLMFYMKEAYRSKMDMYADILGACDSLQIITSISRKTGIGYHPLVENVALLRELGLLKEGVVDFNLNGARGFGSKGVGVGYMITDGGRNFLKDYSKAKDYLKPK